MNSLPAKTERLFRLSLPVWVMLALWVPTSARGDLWTNAAGNAIEARLISFERGIVLFQRPDGSQFDMSLASLSTASQQRVVSESGQIEVPERLRTGYGLYVRTLKRLDELHRAGKIGENELTQQRAVIRAQFEKTCLELEIPETSREQLFRLAQSR